MRSSSQVVLFLDRQIVYATSIDLTQGRKEEKRVKPGIAMGPGRVVSFRLPNRPVQIPPEGLPHFPVEKTETQRLSNFGNVHGNKQQFIVTECLVAVRVTYIHGVLQSSKVFLEAQLLSSWRR